jgi:hypothetical protein
MTMNSARFEHSPRLQRVLSVLWDKTPVDGLSIARRAHISNVQQAVRELRANGYSIATITIKDSFTSPLIIQYQLQ